MSQVTPAQIHGLLMEAYTNQLRQFRQDYEVRIANMLRVSTDLPQGTVIAMAVAVSHKMADMLEGITVLEADKIIKGAL